MSTEQAAAPQENVEAGAPVRVLPTADDVAAFIAGDDVPRINHLFDQRPLPLFDALWMQLKKEELLPQHWQLLPDTEIDPALFDRLPEVGRLRAFYRHQELSRARLQELQTAWIHLRGQQPSLWTVADVFVALRRIIEAKEEVDFHNLLAAVRDVWRNMTLPAGRDRIDELWLVLEFVRSKTKK